MAIGPTIQPNAVSAEEEGEREEEKVGGTKIEWKREKAVNRLIGVKIKSGKYCE